MQSLWVENQTLSLHNSPSNIESEPSNAVEQNVQVYSRSQVAGNGDYAPLIFESFLGIIHSFFCFSKSSTALANLVNCWVVRLSGLVEIAVVFMRVAE